MLSPGPAVGRGSTCSLPYEKPSHAAAHGSSPAGELGERSSSGVTLLKCLYSRMPLPSVDPFATILTVSCAFARPRGSLAYRPISCAIRLRDWVEEEVLQHFDLVRASHLSSAAGNVPVDYPDCLDKLLPILARLGYRVEAADPWEMLGFAKLEGPDHSEISITLRDRAARALLSLALSGQWKEDERV